MNKLIDAAQQALEALESCREGDYTTGHVIHPSFDEKAVAEAEAAIRAALAEQPAEQEPVACDQCRRIYDGATHAAAMAVFMTRMDAEQPDADDMGVSGWLQEAENRVKRRATQPLESLIYTAPQPQPDDTALLRQALEALEFEASGWEYPPEKTNEAITALRERLK